jgi:hypothetical protein
VLPRLLAVTALLALGACTSGGAEPDKVSLTPPERGACRQLTPADIQATSNDSPVVDCTEKHTAETFAVGEFPADVAGEDIDDPALGAYVFDTCEKKFQKFLGGNESSVMRATAAARARGVTGRSWPSRSSVGSRPSTPPRGTR